MLTYRQFIDEMVAVARRNVSANRIRAHGHPARTNDGDLPLDDDESALRSLFLSLPSEKRELLARLVVSERESAVHDVLSYLEWATVTETLSIKGAGQPFPSEAEVSMHGDFIARLSGWSWDE